MQILAPEGTPAERHERPDGESQQGADREQVVGGDRLADEVEVRPVIGGEVGDRRRFKQGTVKRADRGGQFQAGILRGR